MACPRVKYGGLLPTLCARPCGLLGHVILTNHPLRATLVSYLRHGVDLYDLLLDPFRGASPEKPYNRDRCSPAVFANRIPAALDDFVDSEMQSLIARGCIVKWADVKGPSGSTRPPLIMALSVEPSKPGLIYDARPLNQRVKRIPFSMDTVSRVANVASEGCYMTSLEDSSAFHHILLRPSSWPLFGLSYKGVDYCWAVLPFGFSLSPWCYHTLSDAKAAFLRSKGTPALAYLDDSWLSNVLATHGGPAKEQWLAACEATHVAMLVSFMCGQFVSVKKCELRPITAIRYLGIICDSRTMTFRIPQDKLDQLHDLVRTALNSGGVAYRTLQRIAGKCMSMTVAIRPASLWTHAMFAVLASMEKAGRSRVDLSLDANADLLGEFKQWLSLAATSHEGPWHKARHLPVKLDGSSDASTLGWGGSSTLWATPTEQEESSRTTGYGSTSIKRRCSPCTISCGFSVCGSLQTCAGRKSSWKSTTQP